MIDNALLIAVLLCAIAGASAYVGAFLGHLDEDAGGRLPESACNAITALGGGALIGAVGLMLVPHGLEAQPVWLAAITFLAGGGAALLVDRALNRSGTPASQLVALNLDFIPEAMIVGAVVSQNRPLAMFLAAVMVAQNLPEGFNAYREIRRSHAEFLRANILKLMLLCIVVGPLSAGVGFAFFTLDNQMLGMIMTFFAGGILYLVFQDIAPEAYKRGDWAPAFAAVSGFTVALVGSGLTE